MPLLSFLPNGAYIFDKDGTLLDTESLWVQTFQQVLKSYQIEHTLALHARMMGGGIFSAVRLAQKEFSSLPQGEAQADALEREIWRIYAEIKRTHGVQMRPGAREFLERCHGEGVIMALATSAGHTDTDEDVVALNLAPFFKTIVTGSDIVHPKPAPDIYLEAARRLNVPPAVCTAFEDAENGIRSAHEAGMQVVFLRDPRFNVMPPSEVALTIRGFTELLSG